MAIAFSKRGLLVQVRQFFNRWDLAQISVSS
jgi:hypothetical protein